MKLYLLALMFLLSGTSKAYVYYENCPYKYLLLSADICSDRQLSMAQVGFIDATVKETPLRLGIFLENMGFHIELSRNKPMIWIVSEEDLNNPKYFTKFDLPIVGLTVGDRVFITPKSLSSEPETLRHELAHFFIHDVIDRDTDELLARKFEIIQ